MGNVVVIYIAAGRPSAEARAVAASIEAERFRVVYREARHFDAGQREDFVRVLVDHEVGEKKAIEIFEAYGAAEILAPPAPEASESEASPPPDSSGEKAPPPPPGAAADAPPAPEPAEKPRRGRARE